MRHYELDTPEAFRDRLRGFWYREIDFGNSPSVFEVLPDGHAEIIFHFGNGCSLLIGGVPQSLPSPFIVGLLQKPVYFQGQGRLQILGIKCFPWAIYELLNLPPVQGGVGHITHPIAGLQTQLELLAAGGKINDALVLVQNWFLREYITSSKATLIKAGEAMLNAKGSMTVSDIAAAAHATVRTLERKFKTSSGHTIKDISSLIRFEQVRNRLWENPQTIISSLAYELGYADQSHLNREFKRYSGLTAAAFAKKIRAQKDLSGDFVAIVLSPQ